MTNDARERRERTNAENVRPERPPKRPPKLAETPHDLRLAMEVRDSIPWRTGTGDDQPRPGLGPAAKSSYRRRSVCSVGLGGMSAILGPVLWSESQTTMVLLRNPHCIKPARSHFFSRTKGVCQRRRHPSPLGPLAGSTGRIGCV